MSNISAANSGSFSAAGPLNTITGPLEPLSINLSGRTCAGCGAGFEESGNVWHEMCPTCRHCEACGSEGIAFIKDPDKPPFVRCLRCLHGRELEPTEGAP